MDADKLDATTLLKHDPEYGVLVCLKCRYAIQKTALDSHLLRHKIYREERKRLVASVSHLNVLEPNDVPVPAATSPAIDYLAKFGGLRCTIPSCGHLTVSMKRMQLHWKQAHDCVSSTTALADLASDVTLQTFFRGNKVRYFEVEPTLTVAADTIESRDVGCRDLADRDIHSSGAHEVTSPTVSIERSTDPLDLSDMRLLNYFHHFTTKTSLTLPFSNDSPLQELYWQEAVVAKALQCHQLMHGLLAISACHMAGLTDDPTTRQLHCGYEAKYASMFASQTETAEPDEVSKQMIVHVRCVLHMAQLALHGPSHAKATGPVRECSISVSLREILSLENIRPLPPCLIGARAAAKNSDGDTVVDSPMSGLRTLQTRMFGLLRRPSNIGDALTIIKSIELLTETCNSIVAHDDSEDCWKAAAGWLKAVPRRFHEMIDDLDAVALLVMAYWSAIMVTRAERQGCWFLKGVVKASVLQVAERLVVEKHPLLPLILDFGST